MSAVITEGLHSIGEIPGYFFRDTRGREKDRSSVIKSISYRIRAFTASDDHAQPEDILRGEHAAGKVRKLRSMDLESRKQVVDFEEEPVSLGEYSRPSYLDLPPGTVFIGREPVTLATAEDLARRTREQAETISRSLNPGRFRRLFENDSSLALRLRALVGLQKPA